MTDLQKLTVAMNEAEKYPDLDSSLLERLWEKLEAQKDQGVVPPRLNSVDRKEFVNFTKKLLERIKGCGKII